VQNKSPIFGRTFSGLVLFSALLLAPLAAFAGLTEFFSATGRLSLSVDGGGSFNPNGTGTSHIIQVEKPNASATVRKAFVMATSFCAPNPIPDNSVSINGNPVVWSDSVVNSFAFSVRADVTSTVKPAVDSAAVGRINFIVAEDANNDFCIDGEVLVVVFDNPVQTRDTTVILLFGGQAQGGDNFAITLAEPINPASPNALADMGLGISFGFQGFGPPHECGPVSGQFSIVDVNGHRLTSCAGGYDDGQPANGALITVGGLDDSNDNPADPFQQAADGQTPRVNDDELYSLLPLITGEDSSISVFTQNPSGDDNIFFAYFNLSGAAIVGEGIVLSPISASNPVGTDHTVTAKVADARGDPVSGVLVTFDVISGPNQGAHGTDTTDANGEATFTYTDNSGAGTDQIQASFVDSTADTKTSNTVTKEWTTSQANTSPVADPQSVTTPEDTQKVITLTGSDADGDALTFITVTPPGHGDLSQLTPASLVAQKTKTKRQKQKKQKPKKTVPGTIASTLPPKPAAVLIQSTAANNVTYTPDPNFNGSDSFTFKVNDGKTNSTPATVNITVTPTDDPTVILSGTFERRVYSSPGIAAVLKFLNPDGDDSVNLGVPLLQARNDPKGCGSNVLASDPVTIAPPFFSELESLVPDPSDPTQSIGEIKTLEIGPAAKDAATALGCNVTLVLTGFTVHPVGNSPNAFSGTACIDTDTDLVTSPCSGTPTAVTRQLRTNATARKIAPPVVR
jgi:hypothetical protein